MTGLTLEQASHRRDADATSERGLGGGGAYVSPIVSAFELHAGRSLIGQSSCLRQARSRRGAGNHASPSRNKLTFLDGSSRMEEVRPRRKLADRDRLSLLVLIRIAAARDDD